MLEFLVRRAWAQRSLVAAVLFTVTLTGCALTALAAYGDAVADAGLRRVLTDRSAARALLEAEADVGATDRERLDALVREAAEDAYDGLPVSVHASTRTGPYQLPRDARAVQGGPGDGDGPRLTLLATFDASRVAFTAGARPGPVRDGEEGAVPVAVHETAARALGLEPGDRVTLADRRDGEPLEVRVTGLYRPADRDDPYWRLDPLAGRGIRTVDFTTYGPLLADPSALTGDRAAPAAVSWQARADFSTVTADRADRIRQSAERAVERLGAVPGVEADTGLPGLLAEAERSLRVSRSAVLVGAAELALLAGCAIVLVAGALHEPRAGEGALLRARGGTGRRLAALTAAEALLLALPAAVVAALAAGPLTELLAGYGPQALAGVRAPGAADGRTWAVAAATALGCAAVLTAPALRRRGAYVRERSARLRRPAVGTALRAGADAGLLAVAVAAYQQLARHAQDGGASPGGGGLLGADPVLVLAPACCLLAAAVPAVRLLPAVLRATRWAAGRSRGLVTAAAHWQLSRRPGRAAGPMLLGVLAVAAVTLTAGQAASWDRSQQDRADHAAGADLRVTGSSTPVFGQGGAYDGIDGIAAVTPVARERVVLTGNRTATLLAMDTRQAADVVRLRPDLADAPAGRLYAPLRPGGREPSGIVLPPDTRRLVLAARLRADGAGRGGGTTVGQGEVRAVFRDRYGTPHTFSLGTLPADGEPHRLTADFAAAAGAAGTPAGPLGLVRLTVDHPLPDRPERLRLTVDGLRAVTGGGTVEVEGPADADWQALARIDDPDFRAAPERGYVEMEAGTPAVARRGTVFDVRYGSGAQPEPPPWESRHRGALTLRVAGDPGVPAAVATDAFLAAQGARVGQTTTVEVSGVRLDVRVAGAVRALPTLSAHDGEAAAGALLMDLRTLQDALLARSAQGVQPAEWWLAAESGRDAGVAGALRARPEGMALVVRDELARELASDPLGAGPRTALTAVALAGALLALAAFAVVTVGALRERADDLAVLRALGAPRRRIAASIAAEQGFLAVAAVGLGALAGVALTRLIVPLTVVTAQGARPEPDVAVVLPGWLLPVLAAVAVAVPAAVTAAAAARRGRPADALRRMEE